MKAILCLAIFFSQSAMGWDLLNFFSKSNSNVQEMVAPKSCPPDQSTGAQPYNFNINYDAQCNLPDRRFIKDNFNSAIEEGLSCLNEMPNVQAQKHYQEIIESLSSPKHPFKVNCPDKKYFPGTAGAFVRTGGINGKFARNMSVNYTQKDLKYLKEKIFHEMFHTIGHSHDDGHEYAYACSECCSNKNQAACDICVDDGSNPAKTARLLERWVRANGNKNKTINRHLISLNQQDFPNPKTLNVYLEFLKRNYPSVYFAFKTRLEKKEELKKADLENFELLSPELYEGEKKEYSQNRKVSKRFAKILHSLQLGDFNSAQKEYHKINPDDLGSRSLRSLYSDLDFL